MPASAWAVAPPTCGRCASSSKEGEEIAGCLVCGARGAGTVRMFETGSDASGAVITTALYQNLPASRRSARCESPGEGRKLLAFSDSRQSAAYFAPYLEDSYATAAASTADRSGLLAAHADEEPVAVEDVVFKTRSNGDGGQALPGGDDRTAATRMVAPWVMAEVLATDDRQSLEGLGLVGACPLSRPRLACTEAPSGSWAYRGRGLGVPPGAGADAATAGCRHDAGGRATQRRDLRAATRADPGPAVGPEAIRKVLSWLPGRGHQPTSGLRATGTGATRQPGRRGTRAHGHLGLPHAQRRHPSTG